MTTSAILMMALFIVVIWGGLALAIVYLMRNPDEAAGVLGTDPNATDEVLAAMETQ